jgi:hypothetical protein
VGVRLNQPAPPVRPQSEPLPAGDALGAYLAHVEHACSTCRGLFTAPLVALRCDACEAAHEVDQAARAARAELRASGIPEQLLWSTLAAPELRTRTRDADVRAVLRLLPELLALAAGTKTPFAGTPIVLLAGPPGAGKSSIAAAAARVALERLRLGRPAVRWLGALEAEQAMRTTRLGTPDPEVVASAKTRPFTVLDDVGQEANDGATQALKDIVAARHEKGRATLVTTGLPLEQLGARYGGGFLRRVMCGGTVVVGGQTNWGGYFGIGGAP